MLIPVMDFYQALVTKVELKFGALPSKNILMLIMIFPTIGEHSFVWL